MFKSKFKTKSLSTNYLVNALTIFLSAFLLFQIQPMIGKALLPWFGGTTAVWATSLMFFTFALFVGYLYVYFISKLNVKKQAGIHLILLAASTIFTIYTVTTRGKLVIPLGWTSGTGLSPSVAVSYILTLSVGLPYVVLATTSPLVQHWFSIRESKEPYKLYAISNSGSFLALLSYPFIFERLTTLQNQQKMWSLFFVIFSAFCAYICATTWKTGSDEVKAVKPIPQEKTRYPWIRWTLFSGFAAYMLVATSTAITQNIAPIPLLWVIPLSIYLLTFILAYSGIGRDNVTLAGLAVFTAAAIAQTQSFYKLLGLLFIHCGFLFFVCLVFNAKAYALRPKHDESSIFYLFLAIGGSLGTIAASIVPPLIFKGVYEFKIGIVIVLVFLFIEFYNTKIKAKNFKAKKLIFDTSATLITLIVVLMLFFSHTRYVIFEQRSFFGHNIVKRNQTYTFLVNNGVTHGLELNDTSKGIVPTSYYSQESGVGLAFSFIRKEAKNNGLKVGTIGLGAGTMAAYCEDGDEFTFFEIDKDIESIAKKYFTYLTKCNNSNIEIGDGRILLDNKLKDANPGQFDLLSIDAFSGDSVPTHLLTLEAMEIYAQQLKSERSIIAFHVTNSYLNLKPVVVAAAKRVGLSYRLVHTEESETGIDKRSDWVLLSKDDNVFSDEIFVEGGATTTVRELPAWTDEKTDIFAVLRL